MSESAGAAYSPAADRLVTLSDGQSAVREAASGRVLGAAFLASRFVAAHPGGRLLLAAAEDHTIRLWQISPELQADFGQRSHPGGLEFMGRTGPADTRFQRLPGRTAAGWAGCRLARQGCRGTRTGPIVGSLQRSSRGQACCPLSWMGRQGGCLEPGRPSTGNRQQPAQDSDGRAATLGREHGPAASPTDSSYQLCFRARVSPSREAAGRG